MKKRWIGGLILLVMALGALGPRCPEKELRKPPEPVKPIEKIVPELRNNTVDAARLIAAENDLLFSVVGEEKTREFPKGRICRQNPMRGSKVRIGSVIEVWVSKGP